LHFFMKSKQEFIMSETILSAEKRVGTGKSYTSKIRRAGKLPAIIYGEIEAPISLEIDAHAFELMYREKHSLITLEIEGKKHQAIIREVQRHPVRGSFLHIDFMEVKKGHKLKMSVPLVFVGAAKGVKSGGVFSETKNEINIEVLPKNIPDNVEINIENLDVGDAIRVEDIVSDTFEILDDLNDLICNVEQPKIEEEPDEEGTDAEPAEPEVITAKDRDEEE
jgi:large subunit ribosomal protein L25